MRIWLSNFLDSLSEFLAHRKGLLPTLGILLVLLNLMFRLLNLPILSDTDLFLHLGVIIAILGLMLAWAL